ncbi:PPK2 family polyphosphate kinase [Microbulbifer hydrolyticus]|uniref:PPK2 family polyphosphate:nucleotide phosphotransferase n=1 Tax=Microbulbifer hydrolyticus TaxID=48074 RepID=A0A6P1T9D8_9GAMM|nr:PPK2 family polyphosphate kinase [Microbulbifer hydrolyticus]MBB5212781.1 PPK2 family polyphosphate:nucleotide phosphotransferase [Microbulbifer hydrolyticus]QHQ38421.1 polyphosphate kinase 2 family protein [Microbulbifer hydrolyticus]
MNIDWKAIRFDGKEEYRQGKSPTWIDPLYTDKKDYQKKIRKLRSDIDVRQQVMYAHNRYSLLTIFQALDAAGKDGTIRAVFNGVNPHGVEITSFKHPTSAELEHNFLWRTSIVMPKRGNIGVFNRSYYEEVLVCRVHPELITEYQKIPGEHTRDLDALFASRFEAIRALERYSADNGTVTLKFFLNLSRTEQRNRFLSRIDEPDKNWKFSEADLKERGFWDDYQRAFEDMINETATPHAPWFVVPADDKKNMRLIVASAVLQALDEMKMCYPTVSKARRKELREYRKQLLKD